MATSPDRRTIVRWTQTKGLSQRRAILKWFERARRRYDTDRDHVNTELGASIVELAQHHRRYGVGIACLNLPQRSEFVNYKRVERLHRFEKIQSQRRKGKKRDLSERYPLERLSRLNEVWFKNFLFDWTANRKTLKWLTLVDDST